MTDPTRVEETFENLRSHAEYKVQISGNHSNLASERKTLAAQEGAKFRAMLNSFHVAQKVLEEQLTKLRSVEEPDDIEIQGHLFAIKNLRDLMAQAERGAVQNEGAFNALAAMERTFQKEASDASARIRGLELQEKKARQMSSRNSAPEEEILVMGVGSAKVPMVDPQQRESVAQGPQDVFSGDLGGTGRP